MHLKNSQKVCLELTTIFNGLSTMLQKNIEDQPEVKTFIEGIELTHVNLEKTFNKHEITKIDVKVGDEFDPNLHDAAVKLPLGAVPDVGANQVAFIQTVGWRYRDIELRAPKVGVITE